jgi:hypothetical protein
MRFFELPHALTKLETSKKNVIIFESSRRVHSRRRIYELYQRHDNGFKYWGRVDDRRLAVSTAKASPQRGREGLKWSAYGSHMQGVICRNPGQCS